MKELNHTQLEQVSGASYSIGDLGYDVGVGIIYVLGGGAGEDLGIMIYSLVHE